MVGRRHNTPPTIKQITTRRIRDEEYPQTRNKIHYGVREALHNDKGLFMLRCLGEHEIVPILAEVNQRAIDNRIVGGTLTYNLLRSGCYWSTLMNNYMLFVRKYEKKLEARQSTSCTSGTPTFYHDAMTVLPMGCGHSRPFPLAPDRLKFMIIGLSYFSKWM